MKERRRFPITAILMFILIALSVPSVAFADEQCVLPQNVIEISSEAFSNCDSITDVVLPNSVRRVMARAFFACDDLTDVTIPENVEFIATDAFDECPKLKLKVYKDSYAHNWAVENGKTFSFIEDELYVENDFRFVFINGEEARIVKYLGAETGILMVPETLGDHKVTAIGDEAFTSECKAQSIVLPDTLKTIDSSAFYYCGFKTINIPSSVETIGGVAFLGCSGFESITIPASVVEIEGNPFRGCRGLKSIVVAEDNPNYTIFQNGLVRKDERRLISYPYGLINGTFTIPDGITIIDDYAFGFESPSCQKMVIPDSVEVIGDHAFCFSHATTIEIGGGVKEMGPDAFSYAHSLKTVTIAEGTTCISSEAFYNCETLETIHIPDSVTSIGNGAFKNSYKVVIVASPDSYAMQYANENGISNRQVFNGFIYEIDGKTVSIVKYIGDETETLLAPSVIDDMPVVRVKSEAFTSECRAQSIVLPDTLKTIDSSAFYYCGFKTVNIPSSVETIGGVAFLGCSGFESITIPASVVEIEGNPFRGCRGLKSIVVAEDNPNYTIFQNGLVRKDERRLISYPYGLINGTFTIPDGITIIDDYAFGFESPPCQKMVIPNSVEVIGDHAFCFSHATTIEIGGGVKEMGPDAFSYAHSLKTVTIAEGTACISSEAFYNCETLETIYIPDSVTSIGNGAFNNSYKTTIVANTNSYAIQYAKQNNISFEER